MKPDGRLDITRLLAVFQEFFRSHSEHWVERFDHKKAATQLLLHAFLQRIVNHSFVWPRSCFANLTAAGSWPGARRSLPRRPFAAAWLET